MTKKSLYCIRNWKEYNKALENRGSLTLWVSDDAIQSWLYQGAQQQGHPLIFADTAIETVLLLRNVFRLPFRQTEGFLSSIFQMMECDLPVPDYTTVCKRAKEIDIDLQSQTKETPINIVIDSTGFKVYGEGEWKVRIHGKSKRRAWRKIHIAYTPRTGEIFAETVTEAFADDATQVKPLLKQIDQVDQAINAGALDGAYDQHSVHTLFTERGARALIPTSRDAKIKQHGNCHSPPLPRDQILRAIRKTGRTRWRKESGYSMRSLAENCMYRLKTVFGSQLRSRKFENQKVESRIRCRALNIMTHLGMPQSIKIS